MLPLKFKLLFCNQERNYIYVYVELVVETGRQIYDYKCGEVVMKYRTVADMNTKN
jgi:hypothetical protein